MRTLFISTAMALAIGGTALAQQAAPATSVAAPPPSAQPMQGDSSATAPGQASSMGGSSMGSPSMGAAPAASNAGTDTSATVGQTSYPICRTRSQDHCRVPAARRHHPES
ncbi:MAG: hypothetical protein P4L73_10615 [Caulobacteraceae bacterium]|nr:hypothetical protein [Caulobacteraceae bacterium]